MYLRRSSNAGTSSTGSGVHPITQTGQRLPGVSNRSSHPSQNRVRRWPLSEESSESSVRQIRVSQDGRYVVILLVSGTVQVYNTGKGTVHSLWSAGHHVNCITLWSPPPDSSIQETLTNLSQLGSFPSNLSDSVSDSPQDFSDDDDELDPAKERWISQLHGAHVCLLAAGTEKGQLLVWNLDSKSDGGSRHSRNSYGNSVRSSSSHSIQAGGYGWRRRCAVRSILKHGRHETNTGSKEPRPDLLQTARDTIQSTIGSLAGLRKKEVVITIKEESSEVNGEVIADIGSPEEDPGQGPPTSRSLGSSDALETQRFWQGNKPRVFVNPAGLVSNITAVQFTPDGFFVVTGGAIGDVLLWDLSPEGQNMVPKVLGAGEGRPVLSLDVDAMMDGRGYWFALALEGETLQVWEVRDRRKTGLERSSVQSLGEEGEFPVSVNLRVLEGGPIQVFAGYDQFLEQATQVEVKVWERAPRSLTQNLWSWSEAHYMQDVTAVSLAAEQGKLLTISEGGSTLTVWDANSMAPLYTEVVHSSRYAWQQCTISSDGDHFVGLDDGGSLTLVPWNGRGVLKHEAPSGMHLSCMCVSWCGHYMAGGGWRNDEVTRELVKCVAVFRWLEEERRWAERLTVLPPHLGSVERMELSPDGRWLLTSHSGSEGVRDDAIAAWWIQGGRCDLRWAKKLDGEVKCIQFSHDNRIASVVVRQGCAANTSPDSSSLPPPSEVHLWTVSEWPAGRSGSPMESPSVNSRTPGSRFGGNDENGSDNGSEPSDALFTMCSQPPSVVLKHEDGFQSASFRQGPTGPELICINGERKVTLYQEEGLHVWNAFELLCLGPSQRVISCAAADGIKGATALLVAETSCKSSKLWVMGPHSAEEGPGGGPFIGTMKRARLNTRFNLVFFTPHGDAIICLGPGDAQAYDIHTLEPLWWSPMIPTPPARHVVSRASNASYKRQGAFDGEDCARSAFAAFPVPGTPQIIIFDVTLISSQQPSFTDALRALRSLQPRGSKFAYSTSSLGTLSQGGENSPTTVPLQSDQLPPREMDFMRQLLARYPCMVNLREKGIVSWRLPPSLSFSARVASANSRVSRNSSKSSGGDAPSSVNPQARCSLMELLQLGAPARGEHLTLIAVAVALRGGEILDLLLEEHRFANGGVEADSFRSSSFNSGELLPDRGAERGERLPPTMALDLGRIAWVDWHGRERTGDVLELAVDRGDLQAVSKLLEAIPMRTSAYSRGGLIRGLIAVAANYPSMMTPFLDSLGLGPSLPQVVEGVDWAVLSDDSLTLASNRISQRGLWETHILNLEGLLQQHPVCCRCPGCILRRIKAWLREDEECRTNVGNPHGGGRQGRGQPVEGRMVRLRTLSYADYRVNLFWAIVRHCTSENARDVFTTPIMRALLNHKWNTYGRHIVTKTVVAYSVYLLLFLIVVLVPQATEHMGGASAAGRASYVSGATLVVFHLAILIKYRRQWFSKQGQPRTMAIVWFFNNFMTTATVGLIWTCMQYRGADGQGHVPSDLVAATNVVSAASALLICLRGLWFFTSFAMFGPLVSLLLEVVGDIKAFLVVLLLVLLSFSLSYTLLYADGISDFVQEHCNASYNPFSSWPRSAVFLFQSMFGQVDFCPFINAKPRLVQYTATGLFLVFMIVVAIIMLTVLIAIISRTFDRMRKQAEVHFLRGRAQMLFLIETNMSTAQRCNPAWFPAWLHILVPRDMTLRKGPGEASGPILQRSRSKREEKERMSKQLEGLEEKLQGLSSVVQKFAEGRGGNGDLATSSGQPFATIKSSGRTASAGNSPSEVISRRPSHSSSIHMS